MPASVLSDEEEDSAGSLEKTLGHDDSSEVFGASNSPCSGRWSCRRRFLTALRRDEMACFCSVSEGRNTIQVDSGALMLKGN
jgi:hypothetical protein